MFIPEQNVQNYTGKLVTTFLADHQEGKRLS